MTTYASAVNSLLALGHELAKVRKFDPNEMRILMESLGNPQRRFQSVLIAGTNGKGSTAATLASIAEAAGYRTALYTSPHLLKVNERICVDGEAISDAEFTEIFVRVDDAGRKLVAEGKLPQHPSFFEMLTAMAFEYFASRSVELAVLEVGMGGRLDATNIVDPCISVITDIAFDHQKFLGETITEIAREKAGIMRKDSILVTLPQHPEANDVIGKAAMELGTRAVSAVPYVPNVSPGAAKYDNLRPTAAHIQNFLRSRYFLEVMGEEVLLESPLIGRHQLRNVALAIAAAEQLNECGFTITAQNVATGVRDTKWPGRFQLLQATVARPDVVLDVAHNPAGAWALRSSLSEHFDGRPITMIFGAMRDKAIGEMAEILFPIADHVIVTRAGAERAATPEEIAQAASRMFKDPTTEGLESAVSVRAAIEKAITKSAKNAVIVITGSIYVVGEALAVLQPE
ncbi:MAG TPA: folylpolyglutamate synthase/dihydrofolate synthase family protein [Terriglobales bacterium]|nr:folylpolyglutamate synthase/dihydrofolate synthase family protein [Terriglobales bacterium]